MIKVDIDSHLHGNDRRETGMTLTFLLVFLTIILTYVIIRQLRLTLWIQKRN